MTISATGVAGQESLLNSAARTGGLGGSADFSMFLKLLTTQMQHQDPLDPMDTSEYTQQLVQYSQVEQSVTQTGVLKDILARLTTQEIAQAAAFIGREVSFDSAVSGLGATTPANWDVRPERAAASISAQVQDSTGRVVRTLALDPSGGRVVWDGMTDAGGRAAAGAYTLSATALNTAGDPVPVATAAVGTVREIMSEAGSVKLDIGGVRLPLGSLLSVAAPGV